MRSSVRSRTWSAIAASLLIPAAGAAWAAEAAASQDTNAIVQGFVQPPESARPWVYWFWLNGNITREGITADLEAMQRVGIGGVLIMEVDQGAPVGPVGFMSDQWRELFKHVVAEAGRLGLEVNMNNDAGWNGSGGPWIKPEQSMQKVVSSETEVAGPKVVEASLPQPETVAGFYRDIAVLAFPTPGDYRIAEHPGQGGLPGRRTRGRPPRKNFPTEMVIDRASGSSISARAWTSNGRLDLGRPRRAGGRCCASGTPARAPRTRRRRPAVAGWNATSSARRASRPTSTA